MVVVQLASDAYGSFAWIVQVGNEVVFRSAFLHPSDLAAGLFSVQRDRDRSNDGLAAASDEEVFFLLDRFFFGGLHDLLAQLAEDQVWAKHLVSPVLPVEIDATMFLVGERLVFGRDGVFLGAAVAADFDEQLAACRTQLDAALE